VSGGAGAAGGGECDAGSNADHDVRAKAVSRSRRAPQSSGLTTISSSTRSPRTMGRGEAAMKRRSVALVAIGCAILVACFSDRSAGPETVAGECRVRGDPQLRVPPRLPGCAVRGDGHLGQLRRCRSGASHHDIEQLSLELAHHGFGRPLFALSRTTWPPFITKLTRRSAVMSRPGSPSTAMMSASRRVALLRQLTHTCHASQRHSVWVNALKPTRCLRRACRSRPHRKGGH